VGDKLKVYYGPNHKSKVTYEAKVLSTREEDGKEREYLVHYTGWNTRYDEWIRRNRIAENLSWTPARSSKRIGKPEAQQTPSSSQRSSEVSQNIVTRWKSWKSHGIRHPVNNLKKVQIKYQVFLKNGLRRIPPHIP
jgi:RNA binding activity-knot of a chromodomain.